MYDTHDERVIGAITSLRLCYKPSSRIKILDLVGRRSTKDLHPGESCLLFIKLHVPRVRTPRSTNICDIDQDSLFAEIESMVGTLEQEILHVEAGYKHSLIQESNTVTARQICKIRRPKTDSRWSVCSAPDEAFSEPGVHERLARYIAFHCPPEQALELIEHHLGTAAVAEEPVSQLCAHLEQQVRDQRLSAEPMADKPSILISDTSLDADTGITSPTVSSSSTGTITNPLTDTALSSHLFANNQTPKSQTSDRTVLHHKPSIRSLAPPTLSLARPTSGLVSTPSAPVLSTHHPNSSSESSDSAREIWRHIRHASLSTLQQLADAAPETLEQLEAEDEAVRELRRKAVANKRSVGAETLRDWRWDSVGEKESRVSEAPWM